MRRAGEPFHHGPVPDLDADVLAYYGQGREGERLLGGHPSGPLELVRTRHILSRVLPAPAADRSRRLQPPPRHRTGPGVIRGRETLA